MHRLWVLNRTGLNPHSITYKLCAMGALTQSPSLRAHVSEWGAAVRLVCLGGLGASGSDADWYKLGLS